MKIKHWKELDNLLLDEINVHNLSRVLAMDGDGNKISLNYNRKKEEYTWLLGDKVVPIKRWWFVERLLNRQTK